MQRVTFCARMPKFHANLSHYKEMRVDYTRYKTRTFFAAISRPFGPGRQNFNT